MWQGTAPCHALPGGRLEPDLVWSCAEPFHDAEAVRGLLCFSNSRTDLEIGGQPEERPRTRFR